MTIDKDTILKRLGKIEDRLLISRMLDQWAKSEKTYRLLHTDFLDPYQRKLAEGVFSGIREVNYKFHGGFIGAERSVLFFCPDFISEEDLQETFQRIHIRIKGRETLTHRDYLGAFMGLGMKREKIGDILVSEDGASAVVLKEMTDYILYNLTKVGSANVEVQAGDMESLAVEEKDGKEISATLASLRLDCVASAGFGISRTKISDVIKGDKVNLNWESTDNPAKQVNEGDTVSIRGKGRIVLQSVGKVTKKGRISVILKKFV